MHVLTGERLCAPRGSVGGCAGVSWLQIPRVQVHLCENSVSAIESSNVGEEAAVEVDSCVCVYMYVACCYVT